MSADTRPKSAIELIDDAKEWLAIMIKHLPAAQGYRAVKADENLNKALELLRSEVDDGR